jgi:hypothetical protein
VRPEQEEDERKPAMEKRRKDIGCPFGCREAHRKKRAAERAAAYYKGPVGRAKKRGLNGKRGKKAKASKPAKRGKPASGKKAKPKEPERRMAKREDVEFDAGMVTHVRIVTRLIEGRPVSRDEIIEMLKRILRQHSIWRERRIDYVLRSLKEDRPP